MDRSEWELVGFPLALLALGAGCGSQSTRPAPDASTSELPPIGATTAIAQSDVARERARALRARFAGVPGASKRDVGRTATVALPTTADESVRLEDDGSHLTATFALHGASAESRSERADGIALYPGALDGADLLRRVHGEGMEDLIVFEARPAAEVVVYSLDVSRVAGLRLVERTLELLDEGGAPRLRMTTPYLIDEAGTRREAEIALGGCAFDADPRAPWGRAVTRPGAASCEVRVSWQGAVYPALLDPDWTATGSMTGARFDHTATLLVSGEVLVVGGRAAEGTLLSTAELFDESSGSFAVTASMASVRAEHTASRLPSGQVLVAGGSAGSPPGSNALSTAEIYDPAGGTFSLTGSLAYARSQHTSTALPSGGVLLAGGTTSTNYVSTAEIFDAADGGSFAATGSMASARCSHTATLLENGDVLVAGGEFAGGSIPNAEVYDPGSATFTITSSMASARSGHAAALLPSGDVLVVGGAGGGSAALSSAELFDPAGSGSFSSTGAMGTARLEPTATALASGLVLVAGGASTAGTSLSMAELFDAGAGAFSGAVAMISPRYNHQATVLASGRVLVTGGVGLEQEGITNAEIFGVLPGGACAANSDCGSGLCDNGVCCAADCPNGGVCEQCVAGTGACALVTNGADPGSCSGTMACDGSGNCKNAVGQICPDGDGDCAGGLCVNGFCCNVACSSACDVCAQSLGAPANGTCGPASAGYAGSPACGGGLACDGTDATCPSAPCTADADCLPGDYCTAGGACVAQKPQGSSCAAATDCVSSPCRECATGFCVDGFCCDGACDTLCVACAAALQQSLADGGALVNGACAPAAQYTNPHHDDCPTNPSEPCGPDGTCSGSGSCNQAAHVGVLCGATACLGNSVAGMACNGSGACSVATSKACDPWLCQGDACTTTCASDADCGSAGYCAGSTCVARAVGTGTACTADDQCVTGLCVDGVCCNSACAGQCEACNVTGTLGTCTPVVGAPLGSRAACPSGTASNLCAQELCDGIHPLDCGTFVGAAVTCGAASCADGQAQAPGVCDGNGDCKLPALVPCGVYACGPATCNLSCKVDADCASGSTCDTSTSKCINGSTCGVDGVTLTNPAGKSTSCAPYLCSGSACLTQCKSASDCASPAVCDTNGACVAPAAASGASEGGGGCGCETVGGGGGRTGSGSIAVFALALAAARRRRVRDAARPGELGAPRARDRR